MNLLNPSDAALDPVWLNRSVYDEAEEQVHTIRARSNLTMGSLAGEVARARQHIKNSLDCMDALAGVISGTNAGASTSAASNSAASTSTATRSDAAIEDSTELELSSRVSRLERENEELKSSLNDLKKTVSDMKSQIELFTKSKSPAEPVASGSAEENVDLFGSDSDDDEEASKIRDQRLKAYQEKKSRKPALIAKSSILFDVKPWDDETNMASLEAAVRTVQMDGLLWGASKLVPLAYGIHKLQINAIIEDEKVSVDELQETIEGFDDYVQSVDIAAFNKI